ncbi:acetylornithine aminotransferase [Panacagrimonas perspica]|uniref:Acetylornithine aminotransferase n=1 Tax=Panacagrimonas perspica TaxID=381431 RepID=A0A4S3K0V1_9GAMM|nr:acetylornithine/succinyldiaminopimelate transaminase [Panacagrimonas perspica]TDU30733.1 acetylornithine aminotransferase [Panacagrimonas perspica]THD01557.1 bifunctional succinylornithine transaminase/acetylornithine transaminase [Panacagrimonas perspica]
MNAPALPVSRKTFDEVMVPNYAPNEIVPVRGEGSRMWDQNGREYLDFACGIAVTGLGHCHPKLVAALTEQANKLWHLSNVMTNEPALRLAKRLTELSFASKVFFANSGSEANEAAFKLARKHASSRHGSAKHEIISFFNAFHGRTLFAVSVGGQEKYTQGFEPLPGGITHLPFNDVAALTKAVSSRTCAVVIEPVQGEGGVMPATPEFLKAARELCTRHDCLLILDEVQTGNGRCGTYFAYEQYGVTPDILTTAKGLGGGIPVAAMLTTDAVATSLAFGTHGSTYGGNPLATAVALAAVNEIALPETMANVKARGEQMREGILAIARRYGVFDGVRGMGLLLGAPMSASWKGRAKDVVNAGLRHGVWCLVAGADVVRLVPSLVIGEADVEEGLRRLDAACAELAGASRAANA